MHHGRQTERPATSFPKGGGRRGTGTRGGRGRSTRGLPTSRHRPYCRVKTIQRHGTREGPTPRTSTTPATTVTAGMTSPGTGTSSVGSCRSVNPSGSTGYGGSSRCNTSTPVPSEGGFRLLETSDPDHPSRSGYLGVPQPTPHDSW